MKKIKGYKVHWVSKNGDAILSKKSTIYKFSITNLSIRKIYSLKYKNQLLNFFQFNIIIRLLRGGIHHVIKNNDSYLVFFDKRIILINENGIINEYDIPSCKRPLNIYFNQEANEILWGDYIASKTRYPINIYRSDNFSNDWEVVFTFEEGTVRHVHNIIYDKYTNRYLILTGDLDHESGIWETTDFKNVKPILIGSQKYRTTSVIPTEKGLIIPTDSEVEKNYIQYYSYIDSSISKLKDIPGSSIDAKSINGISFISTMYEPSKINKTKNIKLYSSIDYNNWSAILRFRKDVLPSKYFQYPAITIPLYEENYNSDYYFFNIKNTKLFSGVQIYSKDEILKLMKNNHELD